MQWLQRHKGGCEAAPLQAAERPGEAHSILPTSLHFYTGIKQSGIQLILVLTKMTPNTVCDMFRQNNLSCVLFTQ